MKSKHIALVLSTAAFALLGGLMLPACSTTGTSSATTAISNAVETVVDAALPLAAEFGTAYAQSYVNQQVTSGNITPDEAAAINAAIASAASDIVATATNSKGAHYVKVSPQVRAKVQARVRSNLAHPHRLAR